MFLLTVLLRVHRSGALHLTLPSAHSSGAVALSLWASLSCTYSKTSVCLQAEREGPTANAMAQKTAALSGGVPPSNPMDACTISDEENSLTPDS